MKQYRVLNMPRPTRATFETLLNEQAGLGWAYRERHQDQLAGIDVVFERDVVGPPDPTPPAPPAPPAFGDQKRKGGRA